MNTSDVQDSPVITAQIRGHRGELHIDEECHEFTGVSADALRDTLLGRVIQHSARVDRPVRFTVTDESGETRLLVDGEGEVVEEGLEHQVTATGETTQPEAPAAGSSSTTHLTELLAPADDQEDLEEHHEEPSGARGSAARTDVRSRRPEPAPVAEITAPAARETAPAPRREVVPGRQDDGPNGRHTSFVRREVPIAPAEDGWRGALNRMGMRLPPSRKELDELAERDAVSEFYVNARTIAVANPKGGAGKTVTSALLSAVFAAGRGGNVLTADLNTTRGSLGWRTQQGRHAATIVDLLPQVERLSAVETQASALAGFVHHQLTDKYDVLQSDQSVAGEHEMTAEDVARVHTLVARFWGLIVCDSGNSERAENWRAMIERADALVVPCTNSADSAEGARLMLEALRTRDEHSRELASRAVVIVSQRDKPTAKVKADMKAIVAGMRDLGAEVVTIPFDSAMQEGVLHFKALRPATKRAWLRAGATVARTL